MTKSKNHHWKNWEHRWNSVKTKDNATSVEPAIKTEIHNQVKNEENGRIRKTVHFLLNTILGKFKNKKNWKVEIWLDQGQAKTNKEVCCGVSFRRPKRSTIHVKKIGTGVYDAVKQCVRVLESMIRKESMSWNKNSKYKAIGQEAI